MIGIWKVKDIISGKKYLNYYGNEDGYSKYIQFKGGGTSRADDLSDLDIPHPEGAYWAAKDGVIYSLYPKGGHLSTCFLDVDPRFDMKYRVEKDTAYFTGIEGKTTEKDWVKYVRIENP